MYHLEVLHRPPTVMGLYRREVVYYLLAADANDALHNAKSYSRTVVSLLHCTHRQRPRKIDGSGHVGSVHN